MSAPNDTITRQDIQIAVNRLNTAMVDAAPKFQTFLEIVVGSMAYLVEQAERSRQTNSTAAPPFVVDHVD